MKSAEQCRRVEELLQLSQGGDATVDEIEELNALLRHNEELRYVAVRSLQFDSMLQEEFQVRNTAIQFETASPSSSHPIITPSRKQVSSSDDSSFLGPWVLMLAATVIGISVVYSTLLYNNNQASVQLASLSTQPVLSISDWSIQDVENVMTVTFQEDAQWDDEVEVGDVISFGRVRLRKGVARLNTVYGAVVILDARERPVLVQIGADRSLTVHEGTVFAKAYDQALGFTLRTPTTSVVDIGTEFAVSVEPSGQSDVTVLQGAVTWLPIDRAPHFGRSMIAEGKSVRFKSASDNHGTLLEDTDAHMNDLREFTTRINSRENHEQPIAHESFEYPLGVMRKDEGGYGWAEPWFKHSLPENPPNGVIRQGGYLIEPAWLQPSSPRYTVVSLASVSARSFIEPIDLGVDQDVYFSFVMRKRVIQSPRDDRCGAGIALRSGFDVKRFGVSIDMRENLTLFSGTEHSGGKTLKPDQTYLIVVKIMLRDDEPDHIFAKAYSESDPPAACEPTKWDVVGKPFSHDGVIDQVRLWSDATAIAAFDELRLGKSWSSVVPIRH
ncbi:FecR domain-containing protein [Rhodopirellula sp. SWK7]|uniref:FecR domain-containing protein n=1 Tax=Rhodopirellula sp. SWK7 TaxID=595460 RepID=UPI0002BED14E|nr:FecR domain-containing protein [Rhodopirellula sp. SWK7]EMI42464.1 FecR protein domain protein [Rhodopirellula sp. SWK7]